MLPPSLLRPFRSTLRRRSLERMFTNVIPSHAERSECAATHHCPDHLRHESQLLPTELESFYPTDCDQTAVQELWQEVDESRNSTEYEIVTASSRSSSAPCPAQPRLLTLEDYYNRNKIVITSGERGRIKTTAAGHFSNLGPQLTRTSSQLQSHRIDTDVMKSMQMKFREYKMNRDSAWEHIQQLFFPPSILRTILSSHSPVPRSASATCFLRKALISKTTNQQNQE